MTERLNVPQRRRYHATQSPGIEWLFSTYRKAHLVRMHKYYRVRGEWGITPDRSQLSLELHSLTGLYAEDYEPPVDHATGDIVIMVADESGSTGHVGSSLVLLPLTARRYQDEEKLLEALIAKYGLTAIHFHELFGRQRKVGARLNEFLNEYVEIVARIPMACLSLSSNRAEIESGFRSRVSTEELFLSLFWTNANRAATGLRPHSIVHIYREQENNLTEAACVKEFEKLLAGLERSSDVTAKHLHVCRHPHIFTKRALLFSSLSDLVAYTTNKIQEKIDRGIDSEKIFRRYRMQLALVHRVFKNYSGLASPELVRLVQRAGATWGRSSQ